MIPGVAWFLLYVFSRLRQTCRRQLLKFTVFNLLPSMGYAIAILFLSCRKIAKPFQHLNSYPVISFRPFFDRIRTTELFCMMSLSPGSRINCYFYYSRVILCLNRPPLLLLSLDITFCFDHFSDHGVWLPFEFYVIKKLALYRILDKFIFCVTI